MHLKVFGAATATTPFFGRLSDGSLPFPWRRALLVPTNGSRGNCERRDVSTSPLCWRQPDVATTNEETLSAVSGTLPESPKHTETPHLSRAETVIESGEPW